MSAGGDPSHIASVASFFVSRIDSAVDKQLDEKIAKANDPTEKERLASLKGKSRHALEVWALFAASLLALLSAFYSCKLAWQSYTFHDISTSNDATPLWLPQIMMALGTIVLAIAFIDELVLEIRGERIVPVSDEATRNE